MGNYDFRRIEQTWQQYWQENRTFAAEKDTTKPKYYVLDMFPYPSGAGLHVGHPLGYIATDIMARYKRLKGYNVLHPMGFDAFGLPAEQYAIQTGIHPAETTRKNIARFQEQMAMLGLHHDPDAVLATSDPDYYKWTQWIFIQLFTHWYDQAAEKARPIAELEAHLAAQGTAGLKAATTHRGRLSAAAWQAMSRPEQAAVLMQYRLAYAGEATVNWCPALGTVLANEEIKDGKSERGGHPVERRQMTQWMLRITAYADRLLAALDRLDWSDAMKAVQTNWIGRSEGASIRFGVEGQSDELEVFTTRPDTLYGVTFMVVAPEHGIVEKITTPAQQAEVAAYVAWAKNRPEVERMADTTKTGVFTGGYALHPLTGARIPIWISDYVVISYGTGAIMAVPSGDQRDWEFAQKFGIPIVQITAEGDLTQGAYDSKEARMINSDFLDGMTGHEAIKAMIARLESLDKGEGQVTYRQRDVIWSRQRYWGEPTPIVYDAEGVAAAVPVTELPLTLPEVDEYKPTPDGAPPLGRAVDWQVLPDGRTRDLNTMPGLAGSSWYFLRYTDAHNDQQFADPSRLAYWMPVDLYVGGTEHAVGHLMYARFWTHFLYDIGTCPVDEPFAKLVNQGMIQGVSAKVFRYSVAEEGTSFSNTIYYPTSEGRPQQVELPAACVQYYCAKLVESLKGLRNCTDHYVPINLVNDHGRESGGYLNETSIRELVKGNFVSPESVFVTSGGYYFDGKFMKFPDAPDTASNKFFVKTVSGEKMSKSKYNTADPAEICQTYGADTLRLYEMFLGPIEVAKPWSTDGITGVSGFLKRYYALYFGEDGAWRVTDEAPTEAELRELHKAIKQVEEGIERLAFNTCVPAFMVLAKELSRMGCHKRAILEPFAVLLSPFAPHLAEELWFHLGHRQTVLQAAFPTWEKRYVVSDEIEYPVQVNGKVRTKISLPAAADKAEVERLALAHERVQAYLEGKVPRKVIVVPGRIVNVVL